MKQICGKIKNYDWGVIGGDSITAKCALLGYHLDTIDEDKPYAELWLGTAKDNISSYFYSDYELEYTLPYLFKFLSIAKPLSIQIHPNKELAEYLNLVKPHIYKDNNHKPEIAIALTDLEALSGLKSLDEIREELINYPEIKINIVDITHKKVLNEFLNIKSETIKDIIDRLQTKEILNKIDSLIIYIHDNFPYDIGVLAPIYMRYVKLDRFEALYIKPDTPHVYLKGDIIECMACSDNVIRLALTSKVKDLETLELLDIETETSLIKPTYHRIYDKLSYDIDVKEFKIDIYKITNEKSIVLKKNTMVVILLGTGLINGMYYTPGCSFMIEMDVEKINFYSSNMSICTISNDNY